jgi:ABC-2 type transport system permease protein
MTAAVFAGSTPATPVQARPVVVADHGHVEALDHRHHPPARSRDPSLIFPLFFAPRNVVVRSRSRPAHFSDVDNFLDFAIAGTIIQGVLFGSVTGGAALATDIENGFFDRLLATPTSRISILLGRLAGAAMFGVLQALFFVLILIPFGVRIEAGVAGMIVIVISGGLTGMAIGGFTAAMALKTGSSEAVQGSFPLLFIALFFSAFFPRETMQGGYKAIAGLNPVSYLIEGIRGLVIDGFTAQHVAERFSCPWDWRRLDLVGSAHPLLTIGITMTVQPPSPGQAAAAQRAVGTRPGDARPSQHPPPAIGVLPCTGDADLPDHRAQWHLLRHHPDPRLPHRSIGQLVPPPACCMGSAFAGVGMGFSAVRDIESGFFDRLRMAPSPRSSLIIGPSFAAWIRVLIVVTITTIVGMLFVPDDRRRARVGHPVHRRTRVGNDRAGMGPRLAYRFGDMRAAALMQMGVFLALFLTSAQAPLSIMTGWLHSVARINPFTNILRLARQGFWAT